MIFKIAKIQFLSVEEEDLSKHINNNMKSIKDKLILAVANEKLTKNKKPQQIPQQIPQQKNHKSNPVFIHVPKVAGTSLKTVLKDHLLFAGHKKSSKFNDRYIISFVRNPYDRFISAFWYIKNGNSGLYRTDKGKRILRSIKKFGSANELALNIDSLKHVKTHTHFLPQTFFLDTKVDFLGKYENLNNDFKKLCNILNIKHCMPPIKNKNNFKNDYLSVEGMKCLEKLYKEDFKKFGYKTRSDNKLEFLKPSKNHKFGSHDYYFMDDYIDTMVKANLATSKEIDEKMYYINGFKCWPGDKAPKNISKSICLNYICKNSTPSTYFPLKYNQYISTYAEIPRINKYNIIWCGSNYKSKTRSNLHLIKYCDHCASNLPFDEYLRLLASSKFCLCLPGFGPKCHREIEAMGLGTVPVFTKGCCSNYWNKLLDGKHFLFVNDKTDFLQLSDISHKKWQEMSDNCKRWFEENVTLEGSFSVFNSIVSQYSN